MKYIPPFGIARKVLNTAPVKGELRVSASYDDLVTFIRFILAGVEIDEEWYLQTYEDVREGIREGAIRSAADHFVYLGYFEGRLPFRIEVDEEWYLRQNPDVAESIQRGVVQSAQRHFENDGYREGRLPFRL
jgi:hypothetical protein